MVADYGLSNRMALLPMARWAWRTPKPLTVDLSGLSVSIHLKGFNHGKGY